MTPNKLTTVSLFISIYGIYLISVKNYKMACVRIFIGYMFDCFDGNFAGRYKMFSKFGDYYDHLSDIFKFIFILTIIYNSDIKRKSKIIFFSITSIFLLLSQISLGCQEILYGKKSFLSILLPLCPDPKYINITRHFGCGTLYLIICILIYNLDKLDRLLTFFNY